MISEALLVSTNLVMVQHSVGPKLLTQLQTGRLVRLKGGQLENQK